MDERVFFNQGDFYVSSTRIALSGQTFATRNVGSVTLRRTGISVLAILLTLFGLILVAGAPAVGLAIAAVGLTWTVWSAMRVNLRMMAGGGEVTALTTSHREFARQLHDAIASAISVR